MLVSEMDDVRHGSFLAAKLLRTISNLLLMSLFIDLIVIISLLVCLKMIILPSDPFRDPVDWKTLGLYDYPELIKKPMDLGQVKRKIENNEYADIHEAAQDIRQIWKNCMEYNQDGSELYLLAEAHSKRFEDMFEKLLKEAGKEVVPAKNDTDEPSLNDKRVFARGLYKISKEQLGKILVELDTKCPDCLTKNKTEDEVEINVDNISPAVFGEMMNLVRSFGGIVDSLAARKPKVAKSAPKKPKVA